jgi:hypothetical protein
MATMANPACSHPLGLLHLAEGGYPQVHGEVHPGLHVLGEVCPSLLILRGVRSGLLVLRAVSSGLLVLGGGGSFRPPHPRGGGPLRPPAGSLFNWI